MEHLEGLFFFSTLYSFLSFGLDFPFHWTKEYLCKVWSKIIYAIGISDKKYSYVKI